MDPTLIVALVVATVGPLVAYLGASRKLSGKIGTSEAADLWAESSRIRDDYRDRLDKSNLRQAACEERIAKLETDNTGLVRENYELRIRIDVLERENVSLKEQVERLLERLANADES
jgi:chromosome segregation ATPase